jgi:long-subunit acyl-CoA synthetase (AMP-forming)
VHTQVVQGYGLTETCAVSFVSAADCFEQMGTVGPPTPLTELQLESVPELNYDATTSEEPKVKCTSVQHLREQGDGCKQGRGLKW